MRVSKRYSADLGGTTCTLAELDDFIAGIKATGVVSSEVTVHFHFSAGGGDPRERDNITIEAS